MKDVVRKVGDAVRSPCAEPRVPNPPALGWQDWALVGVLATVGVVEVLFQDGIVDRPLALLLGVTPLLTLLWRRAQPLAMVIVAYIAHAAIHYAAIFGHHHQSEGLYVTAFVLLLPYSLLRWGSGREAIIGIGVVLGTHAVTAFNDAANAVEVGAGVAILLFPAALGASVRYWSVSRVREIDQVKLRERAQLARELHDTVAHHVSAIVIQAQAGRTVALTDSQAAVDVLEVIEAEASKTLAEMRTMVGVLRRGAEPSGEVLGRARRGVAAKQPGSGARRAVPGPEFFGKDPSFAPQQGVADIVRLAERGGRTPKVEVAPSGDLDDLMPAIDAAVYRLAQESITNALRHARRATRIRVAVDGERDCIRLTVSDDGDVASGNGGATTGYGIVGMTERAELLGGTLHAGPNRERGWTVTAVLPRTGTPS